MPKPMGGKPVDLDQFLLQQQAGQRVVSVLSTSQVQMPEADRMTVVGIFADDSGSLRELRQPVMDGLHLAVTDFRGARGSDYYLDVRGFRQVYFQGMLKDVKPSSFDAYLPCYESTPLICRSRPHLKELRAKVEQYRALGIPTTLAMLIVTDGEPYRDEGEPKDFAQDIQAGDYIAGMGIIYGDDESLVARYASLFQAMGISRIMTPKARPGELRHMFNQFSQSVAAISAA